MFFVLSVTLIAQDALDNKTTERPGGTYQVSDDAESDPVGKYYGTGNGGAPLYNPPEGDDQREAYNLSVDQAPTSGNGRWFTVRAKATRKAFVVTFCTSDVEGCPYTYQVHELKEKLNPRTRQYMLVRSKLIGSGKLCNCN